MGYESALHLVNLKIKVASVTLLRERLADVSKQKSGSLGVFRRVAVIDGDRYLCFRASKDGLDPYDADEDDGTVPALYAKWGNIKPIAAWLKRHVEPDGKLVAHSVEADGEAWGWEFDGKGQMRELALTAVADWV